MNTRYTAVVKQHGDWWIGWIEEVPGFNCQEATKEALKESLKMTLREALELNRDNAKPHQAELQPTQNVITRIVATRATSPN